MHVTPKIDAAPISINSIPLYTYSTRVRSSSSSSPKPIRPAAFFVRWGKRPRACAYITCSADIGANDVDYARLRPSMHARLASYTYIRMYIYMLREARARITYGRETSMPHRGCGVSCVAEGGGGGGGGGG